MNPANIVKLLSDRFPLSGATSAPTADEHDLANRIIAMIENSEAPPVTHPMTLTTISSTPDRIVFNELDSVITQLSETFGEDWGRDLNDLIADESKKLTNSLVQARFSSLKKHLIDTNRFKTEILLHATHAPFTCAPCGDVVLKNFFAKQNHYREHHHRAFSENYSENLELYLSIMKEVQFVAFSFMIAVERPLYCSTLPGAWRRNLDFKDGEKRGYVYLLIDPTLAPKKDSDQQFLRFAQSVFYVGKGSVDKKTLFPQRSLSHGKQQNKPLKDGTSSKGDYIEALKKIKEMPHHVVIFRNCTSAMSFAIEDALINLLIVRDLIITNNQQGKNSAGNAFIFAERVALGTEALYRAFRQYMDKKEVRILKEDFDKLLEEDDWDMMDMFSEFRRQP